SMVVSVLVNLRLVSDAACSAGACRDARSLLPWLTAAGALSLALAVARLFGPVFVSPAVASWLLASPVDRRALLLRRLLVTALSLAGVVLVVVVAAATLGGLAVPALLVLGVGAAALTLAGVGLAAVSQGGGRRATRWTGASWVTWGAAVVAWLGLLALALRLPVGVAWRPSVALAVGVGLGLLALAVLVLGVAARRLPRLVRHQVAPGGRLAPGLSGALATLDLALAYDVVHGHRWHTHLPVRSRRGGPSGPAALVWADLARVRRTPRTVLVPVAAVVVPYAAQAAGAGRVTLLLAALAGFLSGLPLLAGLRVLTRTPSLLRLLPFPPSTARRAALAVPAAVLGLTGLAAAPALARAEGVDPATGAVLGLVVGLASLTGAVRWVSGRPPDYSKPLVSTPAGAVPTNLYGSAARGFDVLLLAVAPVLFSPSIDGAVVSAVVSAAVLSYLLGRA
ncbi:MAG: hypothetical protein JWR20_1478, partial [Marmoricola sp.]|nr:hypothetical protein [Marmoricola sp.]